MTDAQIAKLVSTLVAALVTKPKSPAIVKKHRSFDTSKLSAAIVDGKTEKQLVRFTAVARAFNRKGLKNTEFTLQSGGSDTVRTYKGWLANGRIVNRGQHGVKGLFHISQTSEHKNIKPVDIAPGAKIGDLVSDQHQQA